MRELIINGRRIADNEKPYVIAEIGANHMGDLDLCKEIILAAKNAGADAVKLQIRDNHALYTNDLYHRRYESENAFGPTYGEHRESLEFDFLQLAAIRDYADKIGITIFATAWEFNSLYTCCKLGFPAIKIASGDLSNIPLITKAASNHLPLIISTGGATFADIDRAYNALTAMKAEFAFLHCIASYPNRAEELNLRAIETMRQRYPDVVIGWSSHYSGVDDAVYAYGHGARIIEKHFTVNRALKGTDQAFSLEPRGMETMVHYLTDATAMRGDGVKRPLPSEVAPLEKMSKSIYAARPVAQGQTITREDLCLKSPGGGIPPYLVDDLVGRVAAVDIEVEEMIDFLWHVERGAA